MGPEAEKVDVVKEQVSASPLGEASKERQGQERNAGLVSGVPSYRFHTSFLGLLQQSSRLLLLPVSTSEAFTG